MVGVSCDRSTFPRPSGDPVTMMRHSYIIYYYRTAVISVNVNRDENIKKVLLGGVNIALH